MKLSLKKMLKMDQSTIKKRKTSMTTISLVVVFSVISALVISKNNFVFPQQRSSAFVSIVDADSVKQKTAVIESTSVRLADNIRSSNIKKNVNLTLQDKKAMENELASADKNTISQAELYDAIVKRNGKIDEDMAKRMKNNSMTFSDMEKIDLIAGEILSQEENFMIELGQYKNFDEINSAFEKQAKKTGRFYGSEMLNEPNVYKGAKFEDIKKIIDNGAKLPDNFLASAVYANNLDLAIKLKESGYNINSNYINARNSTSALEMQIESFAINPYESTVEENINNIRKLIDLGVPLKTEDGTRDALDFALEGAYNNDKNEANKLMLVAINLYDSGLALEASHYELLNKIKDKYPELYNQYISNF